MKLKKSVLILLVLSFLTFGSTSVSAIDIIEDDDLRNGLIKQEADKFCYRYDIASVETAASSGWSDQTGISTSGSFIVLPVEDGRVQGHDLYGYCHIFDRHMRYSNGTHKYKYNTYYGIKSQFENARYPTTTMDIIMEVVNRDTSLSWHPTIDGRATKTAYSPTEGQQVTVVLHLTSKWRNLPTKWKNHDWIVVSAYPSGY